MKKFYLLFTTLSLLIILAACEEKSNTSIPEIGILDDISGVWREMVMALWFL